MNKWVKFTESLECDSSSRNEKLKLKEGKEVEFSEIDTQLYKG